MAAMLLYDDHTHVKVKLKAVKKGPHRAKQCYTIPC